VPGRLKTCPTRIYRLKLRITIVVMGLLIGLAARAAVDYYHHFRSQRPITPPAATASPMIKTERAK
jgi:hypothetical protein